MAGLLAWFVCILLVWAVRPIEDRVPVGVDNTLKTPHAVSIAVSCTTLFASAVRNGAPLPALTPQPAGQPPLAYGHTPCDTAHGQARALFVFDTVFVIVGLAALVWLERRRHHGAHTPRVSLSGA